VDARADPVALVGVEVLRPIEDASAHGLLSWLEPRPWSVVPGVLP
jgi:hypothetical protein